MICTSSCSLTRILLAGLIGAAAGYGVSRVIRSSQCTVISPARCALRTDMRRLWAEHVIWTRNYIISAVARLDDLKDVTERLLKNQDDIGAAVAVYYGAEAGKKLTALLKEHILLAAEVVSAAQANNTAALEKANEKWYKNAQDIAKFLSDANPHWTYDALIKMFNMHLKLTTDEAVARIQKNWKNDIKAFDEAFHEILDMADQLTTGIVEQKF